MNASTAGSLYASWGLSQIITTFKQLPSLLVPTHNPRFLNDKQQFLLASGMTHHVTFLEYYILAQAGRENRSNTN